MSDTNLGFLYIAMTYERIGRIYEIPSAKVLLQTERCRSPISFRKLRVHVRARCRDVPGVAFRV